MNEAGCLSLRFNGYFNVISKFDNCSLRISNNLALQRPYNEQFKSTAILAYKFETIKI